MGYHISRSIWRDKIPPNIVTTNKKVIWEAHADLNADGAAKTYKTNIRPTLGYEKGVAMTVTQVLPQHWTLRKTQVCELLLHLNRPLRRWRPKPALSHFSVALASFLGTIEPNAIQKI